jgi:hypothetical protein
MAVEKSKVIATVAKHGKLPAPPIRVLFPALSAMAARVSFWFSLAAAFTKSPVCMTGFPLLFAVYCL